MDGMLSQDEINALLNGIDLTDESDDDVEAAPDGESNEIDESLLSDVEKDAIGEVANISMGSSATTLYSLVNRKVDITTPTVSLANWSGVLDAYERPCVFIQIKYTVGLDGTNILVLKEHDVKVITDLMMGGDGSNVEGELGELHLSAISEAMNQMMGSSATSLSTMLDKMIDISPPEASFVDLSSFKSGGDIAPFLANLFVKIAFRMQIDDLVDSTIMQLYPIDFAKELCDTFLKNQLGDTASEAVPQAAAPQAGPAPQMNMNQMGMQQMQMGMPQMQMGMGMPQMGMDMNQMGTQQMQMGMPQMMPQMQMQMGMPQMMPQTQMMPNMNIQPAQFQSFAKDGNAMPGQENIGLIRDVPLEVTVELGRTSKSIAEILDFTPGTIIELERIAGEPIDILVNGKLVAKGEVVVIEESFGVRVTEIIK